MRHCLLAVAVSLALTAQGPFSPATLEGTVVDAATGQALAGAKIQFPAGVKAITGADGRFRITGLQPGIHILYTVRTPFLPSRETVRLESGQTLDWQVRLARAPVLHGRVEDQDGWPVEGSLVEAVRYVVRDGKRKLEGSGHAQTNDLGEYWMGPIEPGRYYVRASPGVMLASWDGRYGVTYHPAAAAVSDAAMVSLSAGSEQAPVNIRLVRRQGVRLSGTIVLPEGGISRYVGVGVGLDWEDSNVRPSISGRVDRETFTIRYVPPGSYTLWAGVGPGSTPDGIQLELWARQQVNVGTSDLDGLVLKLEPRTPRDVVATVAFESEANKDALLFVLQPEGGSTITEKLRPDGSVLFRQILPGHYRYLHARQWRVNGKMLYLKSAFLGEENILAREFDIPSEPGAALRLTLGAVSTGVVRGVVKDESGRPASQAIVTFVPTVAGGPFSTQSVQTDQTGAFAFSGPEGEYRAFVSRTGLGWEMLPDPEVLQGQTPQTVVIKAGPNPSLELSLAQ